jgi:hypothetical protein
VFGTLTYSDIIQVKLDICESENVTITSAGEVEAQLIFAFTGGIERGFVDYTDVEGFLQVDNRLPATRAGEEITLFYLAHIQ